MVGPRPNSRHAKRLAAALCSTFIAAGAMAYVTVGGQHDHHGHAANGAAGGGGSAAGGAGGSIGGQESGGGGGGGVQLADNTGAGGSNPNGGSPGAYGPGEGGDGPGAGGFMPNGENGLLILADYARTKSGGESGENSTDNSDYAPGLPPGDTADDGPGAPDDLTPLTGDEPGPGPHGDGPKPPTEAGGFGFGLGGFGGGGGAGGGAGGGGGGGGGSGGGGGAGSGGSNGSNGDSVTDPPKPPETNPILPDPGAGATPGDGGQVCMVSLLDTCGQSPADPPFSSTPPAGDPPAGPHGGGGTPGEKLVGGDAPGVPEPAVWLTMILGFATAGLALRARRRKALA